MGRRRLRIGELGSVKTKRIRPGLYEARGRTRTIGGELKQVKTRGRTAQIARDNLDAQAKTVAYRGGSHTIDGENTLHDLVDATIKDMYRVGRLRPQTIRTYGTVLDTVDGKHGDMPIGNLHLNECAPALVTNWIEQVDTRSHSAGKRVKVVLIKAFDYAMKNGINLWEDNPAKRAELQTATTEAAIELSDLDIKGIRETVGAWQSDRKSIPLSLMVDLLIATAMRPSELLALRWTDLDFSKTPATLTVAGTVIVDDKYRTVRQDFTKTKDGFRELDLPDWATERLLEWRLLATDLRVFSTRSGTWYSLANVRRAFREALKGSAYEGLQLRNFRSAVATRLERSRGVEAAAKQLGHRSPAVTDRHYVLRAKRAGDFTEVLDSFAPKS